MANRTADVAVILEREYGHLQDQNIHIEHFFLILGTKLLGKRDDIIATLGGTRVWDTLGKKGPQLLFSTTKRSKSPFETEERQREERLNKEIRTRLAEPKSDPNNPSIIVSCVDPNDPSIIVSRACKYNKQVVKHSLSTPEIQNVLKTPSDEHLDYFYLMITQTITSTVALPSSIILATNIPGNWKAVEPEVNWPLTFIGHFPKKPFETEREREWRLNQEVRIPFKEYLVSLLSQGTQEMPEQQKFVSIVFTRACTYTINM